MTNIPEVCNIPMVCWKNHHEQPGRCKTPEGRKTGGLSGVLQRGKEPEVRSKGSVTPFIYCLWVQRKCLHKCRKGTYNRSIKGLSERM